MTQDIEKWYQENKMKLFWYKYRMMMGLDPEGNSTWLKVKMHFNNVRRKQKIAFETDDPYHAFSIVPLTYGQSLLEKWWDELKDYEKDKFLLRAWANKMDGSLYGYDWWLPYFEDTGFITNCEESRPSEPIALYRGTEPYFIRGMSWTNEKGLADHFSKSTIFISEKYVYKTIVQPEDVLAIFVGDAVDPDNDSHHKNGLEYVINHKHLNFDDIYVYEDGEWKKVKKP